MLRYNLLWVALPYFEHFYYLLVCFVLNCLFVHVSVEFWKSMSNLLAIWWTSTCTSDWANPFATLYRSLSRTNCRGFGWYWWRSWTIFNRDLRTIASEVHSLLTNEVTYKPEFDKARDSTMDLLIISRKGSWSTRIIWGEAVRKKSVESANKKWSIAKLPSRL